MLILVRHAMPAFGPRTEPREWPLGENGRAAARLLALSFPKDAYLVASTETKAWQTLEAAGRVVVRDRRFDEIRRIEPWEGEYRELRRRYVDGDDHPEWEPRSEVAERFGDAIDDHRAAARERPLIVATHGMAMTVWLTARIGLPDPGVFWAGLRFPDALHVDLAAGTITRFLWPDVTPG
ncbi:histidine phosphatase family protein [Catenulispora subtropica]|uniref:Phosphoglycerate mutase n=1 Tax=Catenulispora subtropica TaxID=450798 RepID=A0ABN2RWN2_9ACTN